MLLGSGFQRRTFPFLWVPEVFPASATSFSLLSTATLKWVFACRLPRDSFQDSRLRLSGNGSWSSLYSLGMDRTENIASNISSIVACVFVAAFTWRLLSLCLATGVFTEPFPSNGCHSWAQLTSHNIKMDFRQDGVVWAGLLWLRIVTSGGILWTW
jgi:hypothetical protein